LLAREEEDFSSSSIEAPSVEVLGKEGSVHAGGKPSARQLKEKALSNEHQNVSDVRFAHGCRDELVDFADCVVQDREPEVTVSEGRAAVQIALGCARSARETRPITQSPR
jgi:predicted dehydrogenase